MNKNHKLISYMLLIIIAIINLVLLYAIYNKLLILKYNYHNKPVSSKFMDQNTYDPKRIAITFDDGPHPIYTPKLLDGLKDRGVKVTFFVLGKNIEGNEHILKRMSDEGHSIGNHTYSHVDLTSLSLDKMEIEIEKGNELIYNTTGKYPVLVRPPFGKYTKKITNQLNMILALWTVDPSDSLVDKSATKLADFIIKNSEDNDIILLHDIFENSVDAALLAIDELKKEGYVFVNLEDLILD